MPLPIFAWQSSKPLPSHNFVVLIDVLPIPFSKVSSIEIGIETEALMEGGENRYVHSLSKPVSAEKTLIFERGVDSGLVGSILATTANIALRVGSVYKALVICVLDQWGLPKKMYAASHAILKKRSFSTLNAMSGEVFVESLEFIYQDMTEVPGVNVLFSSIEAGRASSPGQITVQEPFTTPLDPPLPPKPKPERFTPPLDPPLPKKPKPERFTPPLE